MASRASRASDAEPRPATVAARAPRFTARATPWPACGTPEFRIAWDALARCAAEPNPFLESWYLLPSLETLDPGGQVELLRVEADGDLAGIVPLARRGRYYGWPIPHLAGWSHPNAFLGLPLVAAGLEAPFWRTLLAWADGNAGAALFLHLVDIPLEGPLSAALDQVLAEQRRPGALVHKAERAFLNSELGPEGYWEASLSGKKRKELRRQLARLGEEGEVRFVRHTGAEGLDAWIEGFLALEASGWKGQAGSALASRPETAALFGQSLRGAAASDKLERLSLTLDDRPIAMLANFVTPPGVFSYKTAFDERYARFSPGVLLQRENLAVLDRADIAWSDSCAGADHPMIDHIWRERRAIGRFSIGLGSGLRRVAFSAILRIELARSAR